MVPLSPRMVSPVLGFFVFHVVFVATEYQMIRIDALAVVARVHDKLAIHDRQVVQLERNAMRRTVFAVVPDKAVS